MAYIDYQLTGSADILNEEKPLLSHPNGFNHIFALKPIHCIEIAVIKFTDLLIKTQWRIQARDLGIYS